MYTAVWIKIKFKQILKEREDDISTSIIEIILFEIMRLINIETRLFDIEMMDYVLISVLYVCPMLVSVYRYDINTVWFIVEITHMSELSAHLFKVLHSRQKLVINPITRKLLFLFHCFLRKLYPMATLQEKVS